MQMYAQALEADGVTVETQPNIGAREVYMTAFEDGDIDLLPEYNGALLAYQVGEAGVPEDVTSPEEVYDALQEELPEGGETLPQSEAEDKDTLTVTRRPPRSTTSRRSTTSSPSPTSWSSAPARSSASGSRAWSGSRRSTAWSSRSSSRSTPAAR